MFDSNTTRIQQQISQKEYLAMPQTLVLPQIFEREIITGVERYICTYLNNIKVFSDIFIFFHIKTFQLVLLPEEYHTMIRITILNSCHCNIMISDCLLI